MAADFVSVLKKQLDKYGEPALDTRKRIYDGARSALEKKLAEFSPPLSPEVINKQKRSLEDAIASVERDCAKSVPVSDPLAELEDIFSSIDRNKNQSSHVRQPAKTEPARQTTPAATAEPNWQEPSPVPSPPDRAEPVDIEVPAAEEQGRYLFRLSRR